MANSIHDDDMLTGRSTTRKWDGRALLHRLGLSFLSATIRTTTAQTIDPVNSSHLIRFPYVTRTISRVCVGARFTPCFMMAEMRLHHLSASPTPMAAGTAFLLAFTALSTCVESSAQPLLVLDYSAEACRIIGWLPYSHKKLAHPIFTLIYSRTVRKSG